MGRMAEADTFYQSALDGFKAAFGPSHPTTLAAVYSLAGLLQARGAGPWAERLLREALAACDGELGAEHPDTLACLSALARQQVQATGGAGALGSEAPSAGPRALAAGPAARGAAPRAGHAAMGTAVGGARPRMAPRIAAAALGACSAGLLPQHGFAARSGLPPPAGAGLARRPPPRGAAARRGRLRPALRAARAEDPEPEREALLDLERRLAQAGLGRVPPGLPWRAWRHAEGNAEAAYAKVREVMRWRAAEDVDGLLANPEALRDEREWYRTLLHYELRGPDRLGRTVLVEAVGNWDMKAINAVAGDQDGKRRMLRAHALVCELLLRPPEEGEEGGAGPVPPRPAGFVAVLDMAGVSVKQNPLGYPDMLSTLREISQINARYYPMAVEHVFVVNTPLMFDLIWKVVSKLAMPSSGGLVHVLRNGDYRLLADECGRGCLPERLGGPGRAEA